MIYSERASRSATFVSANGECSKMVRVPLMQGSFSESWLQELIAENPSLLESEEIGCEYSNLLCIGREVKVGIGENTGYLDNLYVSSFGKVVIVETKLFRNQESRRTVVAQIIDYAKELQKWDVDDLDNVAADYCYNRCGQASRVFDMMLSAGYLTASDSARFTDALNENLRCASFLLLIVGDGIRSGVEKLADFITTYSSLPFKLCLLELEVYQHQSGLIVIPNILTKTTIIPIHRIVDAQKAIESNPQKVLPSVLPTDEFLRVFSANGGYNLDDVASFVSEICSIPGVSYTVHPSEIRFRITIEKTSIPFLIFGKSGAAGRPASDIWVCPDEITSKLEKCGKLPTEADDYLEFFKDYISKERCKHKPYEVSNGLYYADVLRVVTNSNAFMKAIESLISKISSE